MPGKKNIASKFYKVFNKYNTLNAGIQAMKKGAKWPPDANI